MDIKPIETYYNGYRFRSRLEARWAVFFDEAKIKYQYEPEGFEAKFDEFSFRYLPDFYFPDFDVYGEVKGKPFTQQEKEKMAWCLDYHQTPLCSSNGLLFFGNIPSQRELDDASCDFCIPYAFWCKGIGSDYITFDVDVIYRNHVPQLALKPCLDHCGWVGVTSAPDFPFNSADPILDYLSSGEHEDIALRKFTIDHCLAKARQARFEHGECG